MPFLGARARDLVRLPNDARNFKTPIGWAAFDADWYAAEYHATGDAQALLAFYLDQGQPLGHAPNPWFDEAWHRQAYPDIAESIRVGRVESAFDAYCREGFNGRSPHWLFDEIWYRAQYDDLTEAALLRAGWVNAYDHFLRAGDRAGRSGHRFFDAAVYLSQLDPDDAQDARRIGAYRHCLRRLAGHGAELPTSLYFDPARYRAQYATLVAAAGDAQRFHALRHYLTNTTPSAFDPNGLFSEAYYQERNPDVAEAVAAGRFRNGYAHFLTQGARERRSPHPSVDLAYYAGLPRVADDLAAHVAPDPFTHYLKIGRPSGLPARPPAESQVSELQARALLKAHAVHLAPLLGHAGLEFAPGEHPELSVVMLLHDGFAQTMMTLASLRANCTRGINLVLVDLGSTDETQVIDYYVRGARLLRLGAGADAVHALNAAAAFATTDYLLFLASAVELGGGAIAAALQRIRNDSVAGAVGAKLLRPNGALLEAGGIVWRDGSVSGYMRDASPNQPEANFVRPVDWCSRACLLVRTALFNELGGFDTSLAAVGGEDVDLCIRIAAAGHTVVYDPAVMVTLIDAPVEAGSSASRQAIARKHTAWLRFRYIRAAQVQVFARSTGQSGKRILFLEDTVPLRLIGSGFVRSNDIIRTMARMGHQVTVFPITGIRHDLARIYADMPDTVEVMHDRRYEMLADFITERTDYYDAVWIARTHNLNGAKPILERTIIGSGRPPAIIADTEAISALRDAARAELMGEPPGDVDAAVLAELASADICQNINVVSEMEAERLRGLGFPDVAVIGHMREPAPTPRPFARRNGMLFVGAIHQMDSPNYESLCWFIEEVLPLIEASLGWETRLTVAGFTGQNVDLDRFRHHARVSLRGSVADLRPVYDQHRIFIAPTRYAGGTPYKIYEAASYGIPVVATDLLRSQMGWDEDQDLLSADARDPPAFAGQVIRLYRDEALWTRLRESAIARLQRENGPQAYEQAIARVLDARPGFPTRR